MKLTAEEERLLMGLTILQLGYASLDDKFWKCPACGAVCSITVAEPAIRAHRVRCHRRPKPIVILPRLEPRVTPNMLARCFGARRVRAAFSMFRAGWVRS